MIQDRSNSVPNANFGGFAFFAQDQFDVTNRFRVIGGIRIERFNSSSETDKRFCTSAGIYQNQLEDLGIVNLETGLDVKETAVTGDLGGVYKITDEVSITGRIGPLIQSSKSF